MLRVGIVGWRGMVGSVLVSRMREERDFDPIEPVFFSTSRAGAQGRRSQERGAGEARDGHRGAEVAAGDHLLPGGDYTNEVYPRLRRDGWKGYWIDAASALRMKDDAVIILDPVNMPLIKDALVEGKRDYIGGNCTVSLMLMAWRGSSSATRSSG